MMFPVSYLVYSVNYFTCLRVFCLIYSLQEEEGCEGTNFEVIVTYTVEPLYIRTLGLIVLISEELVVI